VKPNLILYIGSLSPNCNCYKRYKTLSDLGYNVIGIDIDKSIYVKNITASIHHRLNIGYGVYKLNKQTLKAVNDFKPDLIWVDNKPYLWKSTLKSILKKLPNSKMINVVTDDANGRYKFSWKMTPKTAKYYHHHFVQRIENFDEYYGWGANKVDFCLRSFDPNFHKIVELTYEEKEKFSCEVGFIGSYEEERAEYIAHLIDNGIPVKIIGDGWTNKKYWKTIKPHYLSKGVYSEEYVKRLNAIKVVLHFIRVANRDQQDSRTFEIPACGAFMLAQRTPIHENLFKENIETVFFDNKEELLEKCLKYLNDDNLRNNIKANGHKKVHEAKHDHSSRLKYILEKIYSENAITRIEL
jgi:spore maturation protein CgeB